MINFPIPHTAKFISAKTVFPAVYNSMGDGLYTFNVQAEVYPMELNTIYYIDNVQLSANISDAVFQEAQSIAFQLLLKKRIGNTIELPVSYPVYKLTEEKSITVFSKTDKKDNHLDALLTGKLIQTVDLVGKDEIIIYVNFNMYAINDKIFNAHFRDTLKLSLSQQINRG